MPLSRRDLTPALERAFGRRLTVRHIQDEVATFYGIKPEYMRTPSSSVSREARIVRPRQVAMFFARTMTPMSLPEIGRRFGGRDHSTVIHAIHAVEERSHQDPYLEIELEALREKFAA